MANLQTTPLQNNLQTSASRRLLRPTTLLLSLVLLAAPMATLRAQSTIVSGTDPVPVGEPSAMPAYSIFALMLLGMA